MTKVIVLGANGQLGSDLQKVFAESSFELIPLMRKDIDAENPQVSFEVLNGAHFVINCISYHKTDECEDFPEKTFQINSVFVTKLARACAEKKIKLIHISTDYVFAGDKGEPYTEQDAPRGQNLYGISKAAGEQAIQLYCPESFILRVSSLFGVAGASGKGGNFVETMIKMAKDGKDLKVVADQTMSPTHTLEIARATKSIIEKAPTKYGIYHVSGTGSCSWYEFAKTIFETANITAKLAPVTTGEFKTKARRPQMSVLNNKKLSEIYAMPTWQKSLKEYLELKGHI